VFSADLIPSRLWEYLIAAILIMLAPGPSVLFTIARAIAWGRRAAVATVFGNAIGMFLVSILVAIGLGPVLQSSKAFYYAVQLAGGLYLIYLGYAAITASKSDAQSMTSTEGLIVFFAAILPAFVDQEKNNVTSQLLFLGLVFVTIAFISDSTYGILAGTVRQWLASDLGRLIFMRRFGGIVMIGLGLFTIASAIFTA
jgi:threonine/homoserine/homoserine lactone efflux protein